MPEARQTDVCPMTQVPLKIVKRLQEHENKTMPVIEKYKQLHGVVKMDGIGSFNEVFEKICTHIEGKFKNI